MQKRKRQLQPVSSASVRLIRKRSLPEASSVWLAGAFSLLSLAAAVGLACLTLSADAAASPQVLLVIAVALTCGSGLCFTAHWDVNRGRRVESFEIEEDDPPER
jgi:hypothetical protein